MTTCESVTLHDTLGDVTVTVEVTHTGKISVHAFEGNDDVVSAWTNPSDIKKLEKALKRARKAVENGKRR